MKRRSSDSVGDETGRATSDGEVVGGSDTEMNDVGGPQENGQGASTVSNSESVRAKRTRTRANAGQFRREIPARNSDIIGEELLDLENNSISDGTDLFDSCRRTNEAFDQWISQDRNSRLLEKAQHLTDEEFEKFVASLAPAIQSAVTKSKTRSSKQPNANTTRRNEVPEAPKAYIAHHKIYSDSGVTQLIEKVDVELKDGNFMRVIRIIQNLKNGETSLRGHIFQRTQKLDSLFTPKANEVFWIMHVDEDDLRTHEAQSMSTVDVSEVVGLRRIKLTNQSSPALSGTNRNQVDSTAKDGDVLFCRWIHTRTYLNASLRAKGKHTEQSIRRLRQSECDYGYGVEDWLLRLEYRGETVKGGAYRETLSTMLEGSAFRKYTMGDAFCGGGGFGRGADDAGTHVQWAFDRDAAACQTYRTNLPHVDVQCVTADEFIITSNAQHRQVDMVHMSPPCQPFSPAHTTVGRDDEANQAAFLAVDPLIQHVRPRLVSIEETAGILNKNHVDYFNHAINELLSGGFSVRWAKLNAADYGVPQQRIRLIVFASCPGEPLPSFPRPTHSETGIRPMRPWVTINQAICGIPDGCINHNVQGCLRRMRATGRGYSGETTNRTITTNGGGGSYHPSGLRSFTHREYACLQTFPLHHQFPSVAVLKQIGNAVPPLLARRLVTAMIASLKEEDGM